MATVNVPRDYTARPIVEEVVETNNPVVERRKVSWGAIIAGVVITMVVQIALNMLGLAIGAATINPITEVNPIEPAFGTAALLWFAGTGLLALFAGGWTASYLSNTYNHGSGVLHGLVSWGVSSLLVFVMIASGLGNLVNGMAGAVGQGISLLTQGAISTIPAVVDNANLSGLTVDAISQESRGLLNSNTTTTSGTDATDTDAAAEDTTPTEATFQSLEELELNTRVFGFLNSNQEDAAARQEVVTLLSERSGLTPEEADAQLTRWTTSFNAVRDDAEQTIREVGEQLTNTLATVGGGLFLLMLFGAVAAGVGGIVGTRELEVMETTTRRMNGD